jgi:hypothetical protein
MGPSECLLHLMEEADPAPETSYNLNIPNTMDNVQHNNFITINYVQNNVMVFACCLLNASFRLGLLFNTDGAGLQTEM